jgi:hypothetical protein
MCLVRSPDCGTYAVSGDTLTMDEVGAHFGVIMRRTVPLAHEGAKLKIDGNDWHPTAPVTNLSLNGSWTSLYFRAGIIDVFGRIDVDPEVVPVHA